MRSRSPTPSNPRSPLSARLSPQIGHRAACALFWCPRLRALSGLLRPVAGAPSGELCRALHDPIFARAAVNTLIFLVIGINIKMLIALFLSASSSSSALDQMAVGAVILPWAVPSIPTILSVRFMLNPNGAW